jgi:hypothetical protein
MLSKFSGTLMDGNNKPLTGVSGVTFSLYAEAEGGAPLWMETQNVELDKNGHYSITLGSTKSAGLPADIFASGEARWLGVQPEGQSEKPRVLLMSVPYALKAQDAETIGGLPASAFMRSNANGSDSALESSVAGSAGSVHGNSKEEPQVAYSAVKTPTTPGGVVGYMPFWTKAPNIVGNSNLFQTTSGFIGIGTKTPATAFSVNGAVSAIQDFDVDIAGANAGSYTPGIRFGGTATGEAIASNRSSGNANQYGIDFYTNFNNRMSISNLGFVGIGTTTPVMTLDVANGNAIVRGPGNFQNAGETAILNLGDGAHTITAINGQGLYLGAFNSAPVYIQDGTGIVYGTAFVDYSSRRWKTNIHPLHSALDKVEHLRGVSYDLKSNGKHQIGVIAEEVGKVVPELVEYEDNGKDAKGVDYAKLTALLIEATKEQQQLIRKQAHQIKAQQAAFKVQQARIEQLTSQVSAVQSVLATDHINSQSRPAVAQLALAVTK